MNAIEAVTRMFAHRTLTSGEPSHHGPLTLVPVFHDLRAAGYSRFGELPAGSVTVSEVDSGGNVPELRVVNRAATPVLFLEGEVLVGLKQDRTLNISVLVPSAVDLVIPVACVEQGRWHDETSFASRSDIHMSPRARYGKTVGTQISARTTGSHRTDQGAVWDAVSAELRDRAVSSPSEAYRDAAAAPTGDEFGPLFELEPQDEQKGVVAFIGGRPAAADIFDRADTLAGSWTGLVRSYVADAYRAAPMTSTMNAGLDVVFSSLVAGAASEHPGVGEGRIVQLTSRNAVASALVASDVVIHAAALWNQDRPTSARSSMRNRRPSRRRSWQTTLDRNTRNN